MRVNSKGIKACPCALCVCQRRRVHAAGRFRLECTDLEGSPESNPIVQRYEAKKRLVIAPPMDKAKVEAGIIEAATALAKDNSRVVVFVQKPEVATKIEIAIGKKLKRFERGVEVLTGTMRGLERDELLEKPVLKRFLDGKEQPIGASGKQPADSGFHECRRGWFRPQRRSYGLRCGSSRLHDSTSGPCESPRLWDCGGSRIRFR